MSEIEPREGQWGLFLCIYNGKLPPIMAQVRKVTAKQIIANEPPYKHDRRFSRDALLVVFNDCERAEQLKQSLAGVRGELNHRVDAAHQAADEQALALIRKATA